MRVLMLSDDYPPQRRGGTARSVEALVLGLTRQNVDVEVLTTAANSILFREYDGKLAKKGIRVVRCRRPEDCLETLAREVYDVIHANGRSISSIVSVLKGRFHCPVIYTSRTNCHAEVRLGTRPFNMERLQRQDVLLSCSDAILCSSASEARDLTSDYPYYQEKIYVISNALHPEMIPSSRFEQLVTSKSQSVLYVGRFIEKKGVNSLLAATQAVWSCHPGTQFIFVGGHGEPRIVDRIKRLADSSSGLVTIIDWLEDPSELRKWYATASILVVPSLYEPFGLVAIEGMASACAIVASDVGGLSEIIEQGITGIKVPSGNVRALEDAIILLLQDTVLRIRVAKNGYFTVNEKYSFEEIAKKHIKIYKQCLTKVPD